MSWAPMWALRNIFNRLLVAGMLLLLAPGPVAASPQFLILTYHDITRRDVASDDLSPEAFMRQMEFFRSHGYIFISPQEVLAAARGKGRLPNKAVLLTFDDAYESFYTRVFPLLRLLQVPAVLSVVTSWIENPGAQLYKNKQLMTWDQIREVSDSGLVTVASHSHALHKLIPANPQGNLEAAGANLKYMAEARRYETEAEFRRRLRADLAESRDILRQKLGKPVTILTWPFGAYNAIGVEEAGKLGFQMILTLEEGFGRLNELMRLKRYYVRPELFWVPRFLEEKKYDFRERTPLRAAQVDLDLIVNPQSYADSDHNLGLLIERLLKLGVNTVFLQAYCDKEGTGNVKSVFFPNRLLPVELDFLSHAVNRLRVRGIKVFVWMPALSFHLPLKAAKGDPYVQEYKNGRLGRTTSWYTRLSPFAPESLEISRQIFQDLASHVHFDGLLFQDDAYLTNEEDMHPAALAAFQARYGASPSPAALAAGREYQAEWVAFKTQALSNYLMELTKVVKIYRPEALIARNIYSEVITNPQARTWFAQDLDDYLSRYDYTVIMAYSRMEGIQGWGAQKKWFDGMLQAVQSRGAREKVIFKTQTFDWKNRVWVGAEAVARQLTYLLAIGARHVAYYPDDVFAHQPAAKVLAPISSGRDEAVRIRPSPE
ncbi:MAG: poly-beta-1,6-N-acetyl-D-glucosamine N-deacetylase PgaB [Desulfobaccales bacterium]